MNLLRIGRCCRVTRLTVTLPSSSGWRSTSSVSRAKLGQLVQKQHAVVRQADLAGRGDRPAAHNGPSQLTLWCGAAEGPLLDKPRAAAQQPGHGVDLALVSSASS